MIKPDAQVVHELAQIARGFPSAMSWLADNTSIELSRLPMTVNNFAVAQGRCQVLQELKKLLDDAPDHAAQSSQGQPHV